MGFFEKHCIVEAPDTAYYIPEFVSQKTEKLLLKKIYDAPIPKWTCLLNRRLQNWGGLPHPKGMIQEKLPAWLLECTDLLSKYSIFENQTPNHVLVNEYKPGQGIMPHKDGPLYYPTVATISLGCHTVLDFYTSISNGSEKASNRYSFSFLLEARSLLVLKNSMYTDFLHGIAENTTDNFLCKVIENKNHLGNEELKNNRITNLVRDRTRISLTIRNVPKTLKFKLKT